MWCFQSLRPVLSMGVRWVRLSVEVADGRRRGFPDRGLPLRAEIVHCERTRPRDAAFLIGTHGHPQDPLRMPRVGAAHEVAILDQSWGL